MSFFGRLFEKKDAKVASGQKVRGGAKTKEAQKEKASPTDGTTCEFCGRVLREGEGVSVLSSKKGSIDDVFSAAQNAAEKMLTRKYVCPECKAVLCLECGNLAGQKIGSGSTHCPRCNCKVL
jgi:hypothetical protein